MGEATFTPRVLVFYDYACPFCYIDDHRVGELTGRFDIDVTLAPFELRPNLPKEGVSIAQFGGRHSPRVEAYMMRVAREGGFPLQLPDLLPNTHDALVLGELARDESDEKHRELHDAIFRAYFGQGRDIGNRSVLLEIAEEHGVDRDALARAWDDGEYDGRIEAFAHIALHLGVTATPAILICDELYVGSRPTEVLAASIARCLAGAEAAAEPECVEGSDECPSPTELETPSEMAGVR